jgi:ribosome-associated translation inhibitor RaiA
MQILINSDKNIKMHAELSSLIDADLHRFLDRFDSQLTRIEVHVSDQNAGKSGPDDKRCLIEARTKDHSSLTVTDNASDVQASVIGAAGKMQRLLETTFGRLADKHK